MSSAVPIDALPVQQAIALTRELRAVEDITPAIQRILAAREAFTTARTGRVATALALIQQATAVPSGASRVETRMIQRLSELDPDELLALSEALHAAWPAPDATRLRVFRRLDALRELRSATGVSSFEAGLLLWLLDLDRPPALSPPAPPWLAAATPEDLQPLASGLSKRLPLCAALVGAELEQLLVAFFSSSSFSSAPRSP